MARKGMMVGTGKRGYHNVIGKDPAVHSQSARGMKQPQNVNIITPIMKSEIMLDHKENQPIYFYAKERKGDKYIVLKSSGEDWDTAEHKAMTIAKEKGLTLAGGLFNENSKPYNFKEAYVIINIPQKTIPAQRTKQEDFIDNLISYESGGLSPKQENKFLSKNKNTLVKLQGHYGREIKNRNI